MCPPSQAELAERLNLDEPGTDPPNKFPWAMYTPDGQRRIKSLKDAITSRLVFIFKGKTHTDTHVATETEAGGRGAVDMIVGGLVYRASYCSPLETYHSTAFPQAMLHWRRYRYVGAICVVFTLPP